MVFDEETAKSYENWLKTSAGYYCHTKEKQLTLELLAPKNGERLLDVGCKAGNCLLFFKRAGCAVSGLDSSPHMLEIARKKLGNRADLYLGNPEDLPFSDNEFDIVTLSTCLEFVDNPQKAIEEAIRVSSGRVFLGVWNKYSCARTENDMKEIFPLPIRNFGIFEMNAMVKRVLSSTSIQWGSVLFFPIDWHSVTGGIEGYIPVMKNPFGSFLGLAFPVVYTHETLQEPLEKSLKVGVRGGRQVPGTAREMKQ